MCSLICMQFNLNMHDHSTYSIDRTFPPRSVVHSMNIVIGLKGDRNFKGLFTTPYIVAPAVECNVVDLCTLGILRDTHHHILV